MAGGTAPRFALPLGSDPSAAWSEMTHRHACCRTHHYQMCARYRRGTPLLPAVTHRSKHHQEPSRSLDADRSTRLARPIGPSQPPDCPSARDL